MAPAATWKDEKKIEYKINNSLEAETFNFINSIIKNKTTTITDLIGVILNSVINGIAGGGIGVC